MRAAIIIGTHIPIVARVTSRETDVSSQEYDDKSFHTTKLVEKGCNRVAKRRFFGTKDQTRKEIVEKGNNGPDGVKEYLNKEVDF